MKDYLSQIFSAIIGFIFGGFAAHVYYQCKNHSTQSKQTNKNGNNNIASEGAVIANDYHPTTSITVEADPTQKIPDLSEQAKSFMKQLAENNGESFVTFEELGIIKDLFIPNAQKSMVIVDNLRVKKDLDALQKNGYIDYSQPNQTGHIYVLTPEGRDYGRSLISGAGE